MLILLAVMGARRQEGECNGGLKSGRRQQIARSRLLAVERVRASRRDNNCVPSVEAAVV